MTPLHPIYTERTQCQDCYKCIRECPVKAIKVESGYASIIADLCVFCGHCVGTCPHGAKKVRYDRGKVESLLARERKAVVSLAPSYASEFPELRPGQLIAGLKKLGFYAVSETALGAQQVSSHTADMIRAGTQPVLLSTACPVVVEYIEKYRPEAAGNLTPLLSPALAHARLLRGVFGDDVRVVFIGPCIAKKREADLHPDLMAAALTFADLRRWFEDAGIDPAKLSERPEDHFVPERAHNGALYPIEGGMIAGIQGACPVGHFMSSSGFENVERAIDDIQDINSGPTMFMELLACEGGCVNGPKARLGGTGAKRMQVVRGTGAIREVEPPTVPINARYGPTPVPAPLCTETQLREALRSVGKLTLDDELNCGGCGYDSCRDFARALATGRGERQMCVSYMRKLAQKKTHVLMQKMPSAIVIADEQLRIVECNPRFAEFFGENLAPGSQGNLAGVELSGLLPFYGLFRKVLKTGEDVLDREIRFNGRVFNSSVFTIEKDALVGGIFRDATQPAVEKEQIIRRARQVIQKNLLTVQQIAYLIGENAAESEITLNSIVESFSPEDLEGEPPKGGDAS